MPARNKKPCSNQQYLTAAHSTNAGAPDDGSASSPETKHENSALSEIDLVEFIKQVSESAKRKDAPKRRKGFVLIPDKGVKGNEFFAKNWEDVLRFVEDQGLTVEDYIIDSASYSHHDLAFDL